MKDLVATVVLGNAEERPQKSAVVTEPLNLGQDKMGKLEHNEWWPPEWPGWPQDVNARRVVAGLFEIGRFILNAPASLRKERLEQAEERGQHNFSLMSYQVRQTAQDLVSIWQDNALIQFRIRWQKNKDGLEAVKHMRPQWYTAEFKMRKAEEEAARLGVSAYEFFMSRIEHFLISQEEKDEKGIYHGLPDYSELRRQWYSQEPITVPLPWAWDQMLQICQQYAPKDRQIKGIRGGRIRFWVNFTATLVGIALTVVGIALTVVFGLERTQ